MGLRRRGREAALQLLYEWDLSGGADPKKASEIISHHLLSHDHEESQLEQESSLPPFELGPDVQEFCEMLMEGVTHNVREIDQLIESHSTHWKVSRMAAVDRNILRIAVFELLYCEDIPPSVSINEAIEIGKKFGTEESGSFINGVLDHIAKVLKTSPKND